MKSWEICVLMCHHLHSLRISSTHFLLWLLCNSRWDIPLVPLRLLPWSDPHGSLHVDMLKFQWHPTPVLLPGESMDRGAWWAAVRGVAGGRTWLSDFTFTFHFHALEKEMATHSSVLAWRIPGTGEPGGLSSMGLHRVGHNWSDLAAAACSNFSLRERSEALLFSH